MTPSFRIDPEFHGPTLAELLPVIGTIPDPVMARWSGLKKDALSLEKIPPHREVVFVVPDVATHERASASLIGHLPVDQEARDTLRAALVVKDNQTWRSEVAGFGGTKATLALCQIVGAALRAEKKIGGASVTIARDCVLSRLDPMDADVLLRLRSALRG